MSAFTLELSTAGRDAQIAAVGGAVALTAARRLRPVRTRLRGRQGAVQATAMLRLVGCELGSEPRGESG